MLFNLYWLEDGVQYRRENLTMDDVVNLIPSLLISGGEITSIIDRDND